MLIINIEASYAWLFRSLDVIVQMHKIPSIETLTQAMRKNQVMLDVDKYIEKLMHVATSNDFHLIVENMQWYISDTATLKTILHMLHVELDRCFRTISLEAMEARV